MSGNSVWINAEQWSALIARAEKAEAGQALLEAEVVALSTVHARLRAGIQALADEAVAAEGEGVAEQLPLIYVKDLRRLLGPARGGFIQGPARLNDEDSAAALRDLLNPTPEDKP